MRRPFLNLLLAALLGSGFAVATAQMTGPDGGMGPTDPSMPPDSVMMMPPGAFVQFGPFIGGLNRKLERIRSIAVARQNRALYARVESLQNALNDVRHLIEAGEYAEARTRLRRIAADIATLVNRLNEPSPLPPGIAPNYPPSDSSVVILPVLPDSAGVARALDRARALIDSLTHLLDATPNDRARDVLTRASSFADSAEAHLAAGQVRAATFILRHVYEKIHRADELIRLDISVARGLERARARIDSLAARLAENPIPKASERLAAVADIADSVQARLDDGNVIAAARTLEHLRRALARIHELIVLQRWVTERLVRAGQVIDSLEARLAENPNPAAREILAHAPALLDSAQARLDAGQVRAAGRAVKHLYRMLDRVRGAIRLQAHMARALEAFRAELTRADTLIANSGDSAAALWYGKAVEAADSASAQMEEGRLRAAQNRLEHGRKYLDRAIFLATAPERAAREITLLKKRIEEILANVPPDAARERGILARASALADSAQAALDRGEVRHALNLAERVHRALGRLMPHRMPPMSGPYAEPWPMPMDLDQMTLGDLIDLGHQWLGQVIALTDSGVSDEAKALVDEAIRIAAVQMPLALQAGDHEQVRQLALEAFQLGAQAMDAASGDSTSNDDMDEVTQDLYEAGEAAARLAATPTAVNESDAALPTEYAVSNAPNPFNPSTKIRFSLVNGGEVNIAVFNMLGQEVRTLVNENLPAGVHEVVWNGRDDAGSRMASGVYFARMSTAERTVVTRMIMAR